VSREKARQEQQEQETVERTNKCERKSCAEAAKKTKKYRYLERALSKEQTK
jgi:hypothetical protein